MKCIDMLSTFPGGKYILAIETLEQGVKYVHS